MPNVSVAKDAPKTVYFNPWVEPFFAKLSLNNGEIVELQNSGKLTRRQIEQYQTSIVRAEFGELCRSIGLYAFYQCEGLTSITIGNSVRSIDEGAFNGCTSLTSITIPGGVTSIGQYAFSSCSSLTSITSLAAKAPTIQSATFREVKTNGTLTVPVGSTGYDTWMCKDYSYLGFYNWTKVEQ